MWFRFLAGLISLQYMRIFSENNNLVSVDKKTTIMTIMTTDVSLMLSSIITTQKTNDSDLGLPKLTNYKGHSVMRTAPLWVAFQVIACTFCPVRISVLS